MTSAPPLTEKQFMRQVVDLAMTFGCRVYHPFLSKWSEAGFPDLTLVRPPRLVLAELKVKGKVTPSQDEWLALLGACPGVEVHLWRPVDFNDLVEVLR